METSQSQSEENVENDEETFMGLDSLRYNSSQFHHQRSSNFVPDDMRNDSGLRSSNLRESNGAYGLKLSQIDSISSNEFMTTKQVRQSNFITS